jgi:S1-C subfamily serine protease
MPGVVGISVLRVEGNSILDKFDKSAAEKWGVGSGVIVSSNGYILTNNHVAGGESKRIVVTLGDGRNIDGTTVWADPVLDLAMVKVDLTGLATIPLGDANVLQIGEPAIAIGNPLGLQFQRTVTSGIISALNRTIKVDNNYMEDLIQTDASINPGNSGGPLLNSKGEVVGINTIKVTTAEAMGFAIPINVAVPILKQLAEKGEFIEPYLGVFAYDKEVIPFVNTSIKLDKGIYVSNVDENGPAAKSGISVGCIITQVDGIDINTMMQLRTYMYTKRPEDTINVTHITNGKTMTVPIKLAAKDKDGLITR